MEDSISGWGRWQQFRLELICCDFQGEESPSKIDFHRRSLSTDDHLTEGCLPPKVVFHQRSSSTKGRLPLKDVFHRRLSSTEGHPPPIVIFHWRLSSTEGHLQPKIVFHWSLSSTEVCLPDMLPLLSSFTSMIALTMLNDIWEPNSCLLSRTPNLIWPWPQPYPVFNSFSKSFDPNLTLVFSVSFQPQVSIWGTPP